MGGDLTYRRESEWTVFEDELAHTTAIGGRPPALTVGVGPSLDSVGGGEMLGVLQ